VWWFFPIVLGNKCFIEGKGAEPEETADTQSRVWFLILALSVWFFLNPEENCGTIDCEKLPPVYDFSWKESVETGKPCMELLSSGWR